MPLVFQPGDAFQFDWSEDWAVLGGERTKLQVAHFNLSHSLAFILRAYPLQTHEMLFDPSAGIPPAAPAEPWPAPPMSTPFGCWAACPGAASTTT